jgi:aspartate/methionine/tyrosine aminotransferase
VLELQHKRDYVIQRLRALPHVQLPCVPPGAFYVLPDISAYCGTDDTEFCVQLLQRHKLAIVPGSSFGAPGTVRLSYATSLDELTTAMDKLAAFLAHERERLGMME